MSRKTTLTTVVRDERTLPLLFSFTDRLSSAGLLDSLRIIDATDSRAGTLSLRSAIPFDGASGSRTVAVDLDVVKEGKKFHISPGSSGYRHRPTGFVLEKNGPAVTLAARGPGGFVVGFFSGRAGLELVVTGGSMILRTGKGGGSVVSNVDLRDGMRGGVVWRAVTVAWSGDSLDAVLDSGEVVSAPMPEVLGPVDITVSPAAGSNADLVVTYQDQQSLGSHPGVDRSYASYFSSLPDPVDTGLEVFSATDIVFIDAEGWRDVVENGALPVFLGDASYDPLLRRSGVLKRSETVTEAHRSFLSRSAGVLRRFGAFRASNVQLSTAGWSPVCGSAGRTTGAPALVAVLDKGLMDSGLLDGYFELAANGPQGEDLLGSGEEVLAYLDSIVSGDPRHIESFFHELFEVLSPELRVRLADILAGK